MSFCLSFHLALLDRTGAHWLDDLSDVTCKETTGQHVLTIRSCPVNSRLVLRPTLRTGVDWHHGGAV